MFYIQYFYSSLLHICLSLFLISILLSNYLFYFSRNQIYIRSASFYLLTIPYLGSGCVAQLV